MNDLSLRDDLSNNTVGSNLFNSIASKNTFSPCINNSYSEISRLREEIVNKNAQILNWEDRIMQATKACEAWKQETEESNRKVCIIFQVFIFIRNEFNFDFDFFNRL